MYAMNLPSESQRALLRGSKTSVQHSFVLERVELEIKHLQLTLNRL